MIVDAVKKQPRTFTELFHITRLSRKTLSLRLKELCRNGALIKKDGVYELNGVLESENNGRNLARGFTRLVNNRRMKTGLLVIVFLLCSSMSGYVLAMFLVPLQQPMIDQKPIVLGNFTMALDVNDVKDLYAWQVLITYNSSELKVLKILPGGFVGSQYPSWGTTDISEGIFVNATDISDGMLLLAGSLCGNVPGKNGDGRLATIVFGYFIDAYEEPRIAFEEKSFGTFLFDSQASLIPIENSSTVTLTRSKTD